MPSPKKDESAATSQLDKFKDAAHELECDDDEQRFKERVKKLAASPAPRPAPRD